MAKTTRPAAGEPGPDEPESYAAAEAELQQILTALESESVDVDELSGHVERAKVLITWCREQVARAEVTITELLDDEDEAG
ncbi:exodeoxyribonuclease VII small subunit [Euzebya sp.]|uniref:exodeoxyribonuclease VII small subunit n=1 Tax=Euzebya sp. TaxID=1971409 RepID=UPI003511584D